MAKKRTETMATLEQSKDQSLVRTGFTLPQWLLIELEDEARANKRAGREPKSVSAIIRDALELRRNQNR
ncbi:hypothetical protein DNK10_06640 [Pseudomonas daroniae]|nr:hypothetical protein DNK10_06640 [Pseudomonas daroniae]